MERDPGRDGQGGTGLLERTEKKVAHPTMFRVVLLNDDYTPMEFVVHVLQEVFAKTRDESVVLMMKVHKEGAAVAGVYTREIAETKVGAAMDLARQHGYPLLLSAEPDA